MTVKKKNRIKRLREVIRLKRIRQSEIAKEIGMSQSMVSLIFKEKWNPEEAELERIENAVLKLLAQRTEADKRARDLIHGKTTI